MTSTIEKPPPRFKDGPNREKKDWIPYMNQVEELATTENWGKLEELLAQEHPTLPGEREAFIELQKNTTHELSIELDDKGFHVVPKESLEE